MDKATEDKLKKFDEMWPEPAYQDVGSYYATMYQIVERKRLRNLAARGQFELDEDTVKAVDLYSLNFWEIGNLLFAESDRGLMERVAETAVYWDFNKDAEHQTNGMRIISGGQMEDAIDAGIFDDEMNETGSIDADESFLIDRNFHIYSRGTYEECSQAFDKLEEQRREALQEKKKAIHYDIERSGLPDHRGGRDVTADEIRETFGLKSVTINDKLPKKDIHAQLNALYDSLYDIADVFRFPDPKMVSLGGELSIDLGTNVKYKAWLASYTPEKKLIAIGKDNHCSASFIHEYFHAVDDIVGLKIMEDIASGSGKYSRNSTDTYMQINSIFEDESTRFYRDAAAMEPSDYWTDPSEMFARAGEVYFEIELNKRGAVNHYLVNTALCNDSRYPVGEEKAELVQLYGKMIEQFFPEREAPAKAISGVDELRKQHKENATPAKHRKKDIEPEI